MTEHLIERGKAQGIEQGETQAKQEALLKLLQFRFDSVPESVRSYAVERSTPCSSAIYRRYL